MASRPSFPIVGIGASAGGIPAMEGFFRGLPPNAGLAFVIVTHLSPGRESLLHQVIGQYTGLPVVVAENAMVVEPDHVYVMPENTILTIAKGALCLLRPDPAARERKPVDVFFASLAADQGEYAVGVVLSGGDSDGTLGIKAIKGHNGLTVAQMADGWGPRNPGMPNSAIASGLVDVAVPAEEMGAKIAAYAKGFGSVAGAVDEDGAPGGAQPEVAIDRALEQLYVILRSHAGHDFSGYKTKTFLRRVQRRMQLAELSSIDAYIDKLRQEPPEVINLFRDLLINVTDFFRDADAFRELEEMVVPALFEGKTAADSVRIWVPGCATGEEVYSIAILMREQMDRLPEPPNVQIFATDIDDSALAAARMARYPRPLLDGLSPERLQRFFRREGESYVVADKVRELCIFSPHSLIRDPPFSRMDFVSCRNLLIYFGVGIQNRMIPLFHYSLNPGGYLFLGSSENIGTHGDLFSPFGKKHRIFRAREHAGPVRLNALIGLLRTGTPPRDSAVTPRSVGTYPLRHAVDAYVLERVAPPHVVVNEAGDIVYYSSGTGDVLEPAQGAPSRQLATTARRGLRLDLRAALRETAATRQPVVRENILVEEAGKGVRHITLTVAPLPYRDSSEPLYIVLFGPSVRVESTPAALHVDNDSIVELERELRDIRERLQSTIEEYETALEEAKAANEELVSTNEEAQSVNEELEASKEEMQSLNEELNTVNAELGAKVDQATRSTGDLRNLFESTQIATVFLDRDLVVRSFTPASSAFFSLRESDVGRPLSELSSQLDYPEMESHLAAVVATGEPRTHHLARNKQGKFYLVRLIPYRAAHNTVEGVVVTIVDVSSVAQVERQNILIEELNHRVRNMLTVVLTIVKRTGAKASSKEEFIESLKGRLGAMAGAFTLLSARGWAKVLLKTVIEEELAPFAANSALSGPDLALSPDRALSFSMVFHELATNAAKYGALSAHEGKVEVTWSVIEGLVNIVWRESGGPATSQPAIRGFGLSLIEGEIQYRISGRVETLFEAAGLLVRMSFPFDRL